MPYQFTPLFRAEVAGLVALKERRADARLNLG
jgi:hypothetical protein